MQHNLHAFFGPRHTCVKFGFDFEELTEFLIKNKQLLIDERIPNYDDFNVKWDWFRFKAFGA